MTEKPAKITGVSTPSAEQLARETIYTRDEWQHALNALGERADTLLPTVKGYAARQGLTPLLAAYDVLAATGG